jgi:hypothetical protein
MHRTISPCSVNRMQAFGNGDSLGERERRGTEHSEETRVGVSLRFLVRWNALAKRARRSSIDISQGCVRNKGGRQ